MLSRSEGRYFDNKYYCWIEYVSTNKFKWLISDQCHTCNRGTTIIQGWLPRHRHAVWCDGCVVNRTSGRSWLADHNDFNICHVDAVIILGFDLVNAGVFADGVLDVERGCGARDEFLEGVQNSAF